MFSSLNTCGYFCNLVLPQLIKQENHFNYEREDLNFFCYNKCRGGRFSLQSRKRGYYFLFKGKEDLNICIE